MSLILVIDDEKDIRDIVAETLEDEGYTVETAKSSATALDVLARCSPQAILLDIWLEGSNVDGMGLLKFIKQKYPTVPVIMISGHGNIKTAVNAIKNGAYDYIEKPFKIERLLITITRALEAYSYSFERNMQSSYSANEQEFEFIGSSKAIKNIIKESKGLASSNSRCLILGETGTGKQAIARHIHAQSARAKKPLIAIHTANQPSVLIEEIIFGAQGSAALDSVKPSALELAHGGTLFIEDIAELGATVQSRLLSFIQTGQLQKDISTKAINLDVRIFCATSYGCQELSKSEQFNRSLMQRLSTSVLELPTLKERKEDIKGLVEHFIQKFSAALDLPVSTFNQDVLAIFESYNWPGNIRQLKNMIEWILINSNGKKEIDITSIPNNLLGNIGKQFQSFDQKNIEIFNKPLKDARESFEREYILAQLRRFSGNISKTAEYIGMDRTALHRKIKSLDIILELAQ